MKARCRGWIGTSLFVLSCLAAGPSPLSAAETNAASGPQPARAYLEYTEVEYPLVNRGVPVTVSTTPFDEEPEFGRRRIVRGTINFGGQPLQGLPFAWDVSRGQLYLDLNRNGKLTDDQHGIFSRSASGMARSFQAFTNVRVDFPTPAGRYPVLLDLSLNNFNGQIGAYVGLRSFWQSKVSLAGSEWQLGIIENVDQSVGAAKGAFLLVRPWESRTETVNMLDAAAEVFPFTGNLFLKDEAFHLDCVYEVEAGKPRYSIQLAKQAATLGELNLIGRSVGRLLLTAKDYAVLVDSPGPVVRIPVGTYSQYQVRLREGASEAVRDVPFTQPGIAQSMPALIIEERKPALLSAGGPLTNSVTIMQQGRYLVLNYRLAGADGSGYRMLPEDRGNPPAFAVYKNGKEVFSGKFEFG